MDSDQLTGYLYAAYRGYVWRSKLTALRVWRARSLPATLSKTASMPAFTPPVP